MSMSDMPYEEIEYFRPRPGDYILAYYDMNKIPLDECVKFHEELRKIFPEQYVISLPKDNIITAENKEETIEAVFSTLKYFLSKDEYIEAITAEFNKISGDDLK